MTQKDQSAATASTFAGNDPPTESEPTPEKEAPHNETEEAADHGCCENCPSPGSCQRVTTASFASEPVTE